MPKGGEKSKRKQKKKRHEKETKKPRATTFSFCLAESFPSEIYYEEIEAGPQKNGNEK